MSANNNEVVLIGYSGHAYVVADSAVAAQFRLKYYAEINKAALNPFDLDYLGFEGDENFTGWGKGFGFITGVGDNSIRKKISEKIIEKKEKLLSVIHPSASIGSKVKLGHGIFIARNVSISPLAAIGDFGILNTGCIVEHECKISAAAHIAPGAVLAGNVQVGELSFIGANAVIRQGIIIGSNVMIGAGSVVINNVADNETWAGNPAKRIR